jgi:hypothetical protein
MGPFATALAGFKTTVEARTTAIHQGTVLAVRESWVAGSPVTGAPALPIATNNVPTRGQLRRGVRITYTGPTTALIYTTVPYALDVEENPRGVHFTEGGAHGFALTVAGFPRLLGTVTKRVTGYG